MKKNENIINLGLDRTKYILNALNLDYQNLKIIHVAGTNGKGSVCAFLNEILINNFPQFKKIGIYTSPHLHKINERIKINNQEISDKELNKNLKFIEKIANSQNITLTYFEILTLVAIKYFCENSVDIAIFEVGLGGRLDATNIFNKPLATILTSIGFDHTEYLGNTLEKILNEKMGIFKKNIPIVSAVQQKNLKLIIKQKAKQLNSLIYEPTKLNFKLKLNGKHQILNANIAYKIATILKKHYGFGSCGSIKKSIKNTTIPARLEFINNFIFDVSHNEDGISKFVEYFKTIQKKYTKKILVFGLLKDKNYKKIISILINNFDEIYLALPKSERALDLEVLRAEIALQSADKKVKICQNNYSLIFEDISPMIQNNKKNQNIICVLGSFYLVAPMREYYFALQKNKLKGIL